MDATNMLIIAAIGFVILALGLGGGYWFYIATRTKKMTWSAMVYQVGDGEIECLDKYVLDPLVPYTEDIIEKVDKKNGATHYWLQKMKKATPVVTADCVEKWNNKKMVRVLLQGDTCTLLKSGYDSQIGTIIFRPMPHDRINMIKTEQAERKERIQDKKDILAAIAPFVTIGITMIALIIGVYIIVQGALESADNNRMASEEIGKSINGLSNAMLTIYGYDTQNLNNTDAREVKKESIPIPP